MIALQRGLIRTTGFQVPEAAQKAGRSVQWRGLRVDWLGSRLIIT